MIKPRIGRHGLILILAAIALLGFALWLVLGPFPGPGPETRAHFPAYVYNSAMTLAGYEAATKVPDEVLSVIPCYCGCGPSQEHTSLKDCFFKGDGSFADHASDCHLCLVEAVDVEKWYDAGLALKEIRTRIEDKYSRYGPPTSTPPPA